MKATDINRKDIMTAGLRTRRILDPKECWKLWIVELGSLTKVREEFFKRRLFNPKKGEPPNLSAIQKAAYEWMLENQDEAKKDLAWAWKQEGVILTDEKWRMFLVSKAGLVFYQRPGRFDKFVAAGGFEDLVE